MQIRFRQEIAVLWDTIYSFRVQYNRERFEKMAEEYDGERESLELISLFDFTPIEALSPFFCYLKEKHCFLQYCLELLLKNNVDAMEKISMREFLKDLQDSNEVAKRMLCYYFPSLGKEEAEMYLASPADLVLLVRDSDVCNDTVKNNLLAALLNPTKEIQNLSYELVKREQQIKQVHERKANQVTELSLRFTEEQVKACWGENSENSLQLDEIETATACFCIIDKNLIYTWIRDERLLWILGSNYEKLRNPGNKRMNDNDLFTFVSALAEKNRLAFLNYIFEHTGTTGKMLEKEFDMTGPNVYYHLGYLGKAGLVNTESKGRNIEYSINQKKFRDIREYLKKYERKN